jgi:hypothetical protein
MRLPATAGFHIPLAPSGARAFLALLRKSSWSRQTKELFMTDDPRCCGSGHCIIDARGRCWCGQQWDGEKMCHPPLNDGLGMPSADTGAGAQRDREADASY